MRLLFLFVLIFVLAGSGSASAQEIDETASEVTGVTRLVSADMRALHSVDYTGSHATFRAEYENDDDGETIWALSFYGFAEDTTALSTATDIRIQAEGESLDPLRVESRTREVSGTLLEIKRAVFARPAFEQIAAASSVVTIAIGPFQFEAIHARREDLRLILEQVPRETPQTAESGEDTSGG